MKKLLLSLAVAALSFSAFAATETYTCSALGDENINPLDKSVTVGEVTFSFAKSTGSTAPAYYKNGNDIRLYASNVMTVTAAEGYKVDKLEFTLSDVSRLATNAVSSGTLTVSATDATATWEGSASSLTLTVGEKADLSSDPSKAGQFRFSAVTVTYSEGEGDVVPPVTEPDPDQPDQPTDPAEVMTVAEALAYLAAGNEGEATVKGIISKVQEISAQYGNATYYIKDDLSDSQDLEVFRGYWLNGDKFTAGNEIAVGGTVVVSGKLVNYNGTYEFTTGSKIISYTAPEGGDQPDQPEVPAEPTGDYVTFNFADPVSIDSAFDPDNIPADAKDKEFVLTDMTLTAGVIDLESTVTETATNFPRLFCSSAGAWTYRFYKDNTVTISVNDDEYVMTGMVFEATNLDNTSIVFSDNGKFAGNIWVPVSDSGAESMTITKTATGNNPTITTLKVYYTTKAGVESVEADANAPVEYFNLQGVRVINPENGLYIRRQGTTATKVYIK